MRQPSCNAHIEVPETTSLPSPRVASFTSLPYRNGSRYVGLNGKMLQRPLTLSPESRRHWNGNRNMGHVCFPLAVAYSSQRNASHTNLQLAATLATSIPMPRSPAPICHPSSRLGSRPTSICKENHAAGLQHPMPQPLISNSPTARSMTLRRNGPLPKTRSTTCTCDGSSAA